jgi:hypothetical protein
VRVNVYYEVEIFTGVKEGVEQTILRKAAENEMD